MNKTKTTTKEVISITLSQIVVNDDANIIRHELPKIKELAEDLKANGQLMPIVVTNGGSAEQPYRLIAGNRRVAAFREANWGDKPILAVVRQYQKGDHLGPYLDAWTENLRENPNPVELAEFFDHLENGTYPVPEGATAEPVDRDTIAARFSLSRDQVSRYLKIFKNTDPDVAIQAKRVDAPLRLLQAISSIKGEGEEKGEKEEDRAKKQKAVLDRYVEQKGQLESVGRQRGERADKGTTKKAKKKGGDDSDRPSWAINPAKKIGKDGQTHRSIADYMRVLEGKKGARFEGMMDALRLVTGSIVRLEGVVVADFVALDAEDEVEEEVEE